MKVFAIIPARYNSSRFVGKSLASLDGKPIVQHVYERAREMFDYVAVATDDERIKRAVEGFGGMALMTSEKHNSGTDRIAEALIYMQEAVGCAADVVVNIQGDEPFIDKQTVLSLIEIFEKHSAAQIATPVKRFTELDALLNPNNVKALLTENGRAMYFSRLPIPFLRDLPQEKWLERGLHFHHLGVYAFRAKTLLELTKLAPSALEQAEKLEQNRWLENGYQIYTAQTDAISIGIDTPEDLANAENYIQKLKNNLNK